ncbi:hypothetical protein CN918_28790 [Priestia megaterium]|nr:hypothetical protein CN918_28790 [Priestia megaterium]
MTNVLILLAIIILSAGIGYSYGKLGGPTLQNFAFHIMTPIFVAIVSFFATGLLFNWGLACFSLFIFIYPIAYWKIASRTNVSQ